LDQVLTNNGGLAAHGWFAAPKADAPHLALAVNGEPFPHQDRHPRADVFAATPALRCLPDYDVVGVTGHSWNPPGAVRPGAWYRLEILDRRTGKPALNLGRPTWHRLPHPTDPPVPNPERMLRVGGHDTAREFLNVGVQVFGALRDTLRETTGKDFSDFPRILDWGCGCGRLSRYFADLPVQVTGGDVDEDNVKWCSAHLKFGRFETIPLHPPMPFADSAFDLAFGTSVFTHLAEPVQFEWLTELQRVVRPGGILLMSFLGDAAIQVFNLTAEQVRQRNKTGFLDLTKNAILDGYLPEEDYYRDVFHTTDYIRREWGKYFDVVDIIPGGLIVQDLTVLRRR
jgi:SAM-dependent methyltransferase